MYDPDAWCRGMLPLEDELLLTDWKTEAFDAYNGCDEPWSSEQGFLRDVQLKGLQKRVYGQFAMKLPRATTYVWQPAVIHTGAPGVYLCKRTLTRLGMTSAEIDDVPLTVDIGKFSVSTVRVTEHEGRTADGSDLTGDVNILGMEFLGEGVVNTLEQLVHRRIGRPTIPEDIWVTDGKAAFRVSPKRPHVASLKLAIKDYRMYAMDPTLLVIKDPSTGKVLGDKDALHAGVEYVFELPPVNK